MTYQLIETKTLGTATTAIEFTSIPQDGTDLLMLYSGRAASSNLVYLELNGSAANFSRRDLYGTGSQALSSSANDNFIGITGDAVHTSNVFGSMTLYIPNYTGSTAKSFSTDSVNENNASNADIRLLAGLWNNTAAITSLTIKAGGTTNIVAGSTISLYKITKGSSGGVVVS